MITHIATAANQQSSAGEEINQNMEQIAKLVRESSDGAQQAAKACQDLSKLALDLQKSVSKFRLDSIQPGSLTERTPLRKSKSQVLGRKSLAASAS